jgi:hypothetical protein
MPNIPLELWLGGVEAPVTYQGRSGCCIGEDQIVFTVPNSVPTGCAVPLLIQIGNQTSNATVMPVASGSRNCTPSNAGLAAVNVEQAVTAGPVTYGKIKLSRDFNSNGQGYSDDAAFGFIKVLTYVAGSQPFFVSYVDDQPLGGCTVYNSLSPGTNLPAGTAAADAGSSFTVTGPNGSKVVAGSPGQFSATLSVSGTYLSPGAYTVTGTGGADIGAFSAAATVPVAPVLTSFANSTIPPVTRSNGMTVTWAGGAANADVQIEVTAATDNTNSNGATVVCEAATNAGTITIPPYALLALPPGSFAGFSFVQQTAAGGFTATGLNLGVIRTSNAPTYVGGFTLQ